MWYKTANVLRVHSNEYIQSSTKEGNTRTQVRPILVPIPIPILPP